MSTFAASGRADDSLNGISLYRAIWRWHFFAGLLVVPFLISLAVTGSLYLFKDEINNTFFSYRYNVSANGTPLSPSKLSDDAIGAIPNSKLVSFRTPLSSDRSAIVTVSTGGKSVLVFINPYNGKILDTVDAANEFNYVVKRIHSLQYFGTFTNRLIEVVGGFAMVLVVTGIYLWWPRHQTGGVVTVRGTPSKRVFWRDLHAVTGVIAGAVIFFLALTGMPWSGYWGAKRQCLAYQP